MSNEQDKNKVVALLPIKAHSERVKGKNFRLFNGKPLFFWIIETLLSLNEIDQIVINTDARALLLQHGLVENERVIIRDRRTELLGDLININFILEDDVNNVPADIYLMTHTTNPLLRAETIQSALTLFKKAHQQSEADSLFTVNRIQTRFYRADGSAINHEPEALIRTQDLEPWFEENSNFYLFTAASFVKTRARIGKRPILFESSKFESIDIDTPDDWDMAVIAAQYLEKRKACEHA